MWLFVVQNTTTVVKLGMNFAFMQWHNCIVLHALLVFTADLN